MKSTTRWMTLFVAVAAVGVAWFELSTIQKSSELAASQAVIDSYYRARDGILRAKHRNFIDNMKVTLFKAELDSLTPEGSNLRAHAEKVIEPGGKVGHLAEKLAREDYQAIIHHLCSQSEQGLSGPTALSFLTEVVIDDAKAAKYDLGACKGLSHSRSGSE